jgi:hypothetical protein
VRCSAAGPDRKPRSSPIRSSTKASRCAPRPTRTTAGVITREVGGERKEHRFIRADAYASYDDAVNFTLNKARQIVDLQGERIFG